ncbi:hypothetical protein [Roseateles sp.]|uniref:hypothetical protein n=1 Tax=Roseateles sp. TaxID=1971397 RepID=UPI002F400F4D
MKTPQFTLTSVTPTLKASLLLTFADGEKFEVDLVEVITKLHALGPLKDQGLFMKARLGEFDDTVVWDEDGELELAADNLRAMGIEQAGGISHEFIVRWMYENDLNLDGAAIALGMSRRMVAYYRSGAKAVPRTVALACLGWRALRQGQVDERFALAA